MNTCHVIYVGCHLTKDILICKLIKDMFYTREILSKLEKELLTKEIIVLTGMRQIGKTTLLKHLFSLVASQNKAIFDLENPLQRKIFEAENYDAIWQGLAEFGLKNTERAFIFIDEMQNLPEISKVVKYLYDHYQVKFFLTGSSSFYLRNLFPESMAGRKIIFELFPLTFSEFLVFKGVSREEAFDFEDKAKKKNRIAYELYLPFYQEFMDYGGCPAVVLEKDYARKKELMQEIFTSYFEKDVRNLADFKEIGKLRDLILLLTARVGFRLDIGKLSQELAVSRETVYNYLTFLESTYFISLLPKFSGSLDRQAAGSKKLFFGDTGLANILGRLSMGQLFEQSVFQNLRTRHKLFFYNRAEREEIDFVIDGKIGLEVKTSAGQRDYQKLERVSKKLGLAESYLTSFAYSENDQTILAIDL